MSQHYATREAWQRYISVGRIEHAVLREQVRRAWERAHALRVNPQLFHAEALSETETERMRQRLAPFITAARPYAMSLSCAAGVERHAVMLGNEEGVVLDVVGDEQSVSGPQAVPGPGSLLSEEMAGANGIGTPLAEGEYAELVGPEHFIGGFHPFSCQGITIGDGGEVVGVLSTSVRRPQASQRLHDILVCAAHGIEAELLCHRLEEKIDRALSARPGEEHLLEDLRQDIVQSYAAAKLRLQVAARVFESDQNAYALELLRAAREAIATFRSDAALWQDLASSDKGGLTDLDLLEMTRQIERLLETEMATQQVQIVAGRTEPVMVHASRSRLLRELLDVLLRGAKAAGSGGAIVVSVGPSSVVGQVTIQPEPAAGVADRALPALRLAYPRSPLPTSGS
jgi:transcriptional regulator of acetoin/glycerol metabolism